MSFIKRHFCAPSVTRCWNKKGSFFPWIIQNVADNNAPSESNVFQNSPQKEVGKYLC